MFRLPTFPIFLRHGIGNAHIVLFDLNSDNNILDIKKLIFIWYLYEADQTFIIYSKYLYG